jgi:CheY-specific phosphatase CheX
MNIDETQDTYIDTNTLIFAKSVIYTLQDMIGIPFVLNKTSFREATFSSPFDMIAYIHFTGAVQGDYLLGLDEVLAAKLIEVYEEGMSKHDLREMREDYGGFLKELLNIAVGLSIPELEQRFGDLTHASGILIYGEMDLPDVKSGNVLIESKIGQILCGFSLNLAQVKIGRTLEKILRELERITDEANKARKTVKTVLRLFNSASIAVTPDGKILPGCSHSPASVVGLEPDKEIVGMDITTLLNLNFSDSQKLNHILQELKKSDSLSVEEIPLPEQIKLTNKQGNVLKLDWIPVINEENHHLEKLLVIMENLSEAHLHK